MKEIDERNVKHLEEIMHVAHDLLQLPIRGFKETYQSVNSEKIIYDSEFCRINLIWDGWDYLSGNSIQVRYGRLHASNEKTTMIWNGEEYRCWHRVEHALHFLDERSPAETAKLNYSHPIIKPFYEEKILQEFDRRQPEWIAQVHVTIWKHYGQKLFELFDLRRPDLWQQYRQFLKEVYDIQGRSPAIKPSLDKVC